MSLSDFQVFSEFAYSAFTEVLAQQVDLFNEASAGTIILREANHAGDYSDGTLFAKIAGLVRRRDAYGSGAVSEKVLTMLLDTMVKVAAGTPPVRIDPGMFEWINMDQQVAGAVIGQQLAKEALADMLNTSVAAAVAAMANVAAMKSDITAGANAVVTPRALNGAAAKLGDAAGEIRAWVMNGAVIHGLYDNALQNGQMLFEYGNVRVTQDFAGRRYIVSDIPALTNSTTDYKVLGLVPGAIIVDRNDDFTDNVSTLNGNENITRTYQAEWSYNMGIKGFAWDKSSGGKSPTTAALTTAANWDQFVTSYKDGPGVILVADQS